ncbi:MAG: hypothetical protein HQL99_02300 [Magnetococcales bacterium]|nr:hypothetical protein [Magnetococcales bacterium]
MIIEFCQNRQKTDSRIVDDYKETHTMGQYMTIRIPPRREWFGDMEPEYEEIMEWKCLSGWEAQQHTPDGLPLSWRAMIASSRKTRGTNRLGA